MTILALSLPMLPLALWVGYVEVSDALDDAVREYVLEVSV